MGNAISSLIAQASTGGQGDEEENILLSEEHSLVLTCCWVSLKVKQNRTHHATALEGSRSFACVVPRLIFAFVFSHQEIGIFLGSLVEKILTESKPSRCLLTKEDLLRASKVFKNILLKCRHWVSFLSQRHQV